MTLPQDRFAEEWCPHEYRGDVCLYNGHLPTCDRSVADCIAHGDEEEARGLPRLHTLQNGSFPGIATGFFR